MEDVYAANHGGEDELLGQGSSMDGMSSAQCAKSLTNPAERFDLAAPGAGSWENRASPSQARIDSKWRGFNDQASEVRVTIWNSTQQRKISGNAAPMEKNVDEYLRKHPDCEIYAGQDKGVGGKLDRMNGDERGSPRHRSGAEKDAEQRRVSIWNRAEKRKLSGNCAPLEKNLEQYLKDNPHCEVHNNFETKTKKVPKRPRKDTSGAGAETQSRNSSGDISNGHQGFVYYDPFGGASPFKGADSETNPAMTLETLRVKPNPKIEGLVLPKFGTEGKMLSPHADKSLNSFKKESTSGVAANTSLVS